MADGRESPPADDYMENDEFADVSLKPADEPLSGDHFAEATEEQIEHSDPLPENKEQSEVDDETPAQKEDLFKEDEGSSMFKEDEESSMFKEDEESSMFKEEPISTQNEAPSKPAVIDDDEDNSDMFETAVSPEPMQSVSLDTPPMAKIPVQTPLFISKNESNDDDNEIGSESNEVSIEVSDPHKKGEGMNAYLTYKVHTKTSMPSFKRPDLVVDRRFSDFLGLHEKLLAKHRHAGRVVPPAPEKSIVGMTRVKMSKTDEEAVSVNFVEKRRAALERYLNRVARHPTLVQDQDFRDFLEQEELPQSTNTRALSGAGVMRLVKNVEGALNKMTIKMTEEDSWFEEKQQQIESLELQLRKLHVAFEDLVHNRRELASNTAQFAKSAATLGNAEEHTALSRALAQLSDAFEKIETVHQEQANTDYYGVAETLSDYLRIIAEIKEVFMVRAKSWQNWQNAVQSVNKKKEAEAKMQASGRSDKVSQIQSELRELEGRVETSKEDFDNLSAAIKKDIQKFEKDRVVDFRQLVLVFLKRLMKSQEQYMKNWEAFIPEARAIA